MGIPISPSNIKPDSIVTGSSRYITRKVIYYGDRNVLAFDTYIRTPYVPNGKEKIMAITPTYEYRPDLVSYDFYGDSHYWWKIMEANSIHDIYDFKSGLTILLPNLF